MESEREAHGLAEDLFRRESARLVAALVRLLGPSHLTLAEDVVQDALVSALDAWRTGAPDDPAAWIVATAQRRAIDRLRRDARFATLSSELAAEWPTGEAFSVDSDAPNRLAMMFSCCDESLAESTHVTLILRFLCGFSPAEIARAFLVETDTIDRRLHRGRERLAALGKLHDVHDDAEVAARLPSVLRALYLLFNEGYHGSDPDNPVRASMCSEALRLVDLLLASKAAATPAVHALAALFCFNAARLATRIDGDGVFVPLAEQDRARWDRTLAQRGVVHLARSAEGTELTRWHLEAGIACEHTLAPTIAATDWAKIVDLYDALYRTAPGPVIALNRALAIAELRGPEAGREALEAIRKDRRLASYPFFWAALADVDRRAGNKDDARAHYERAIELSRSRAEQASYRRRLRDL